MATGAPDSLARLLLEAQVRYHLDQLSGDRLDSTVSALADDLAAASRHPLADLVDPGAIKPIVTRALATVPSSAAVGAIVELATEVAYEGPGESYPLGDLVDRDRVELLLDELLAAGPLLERALERLTDSPLVAAMATRFMGRVVGEVLQANQAVASRVPGLGSLMSFGTSAASKVVGAADKQLEGLLGDTVGRGGTFAVRRLNHILVETLRDPTTREAILQVWDLAAGEPVEGLSSYASREELTGVVDALHELTITTLARDPAARLGEALVDGFFARFGGYTPTELLDELDLDREDLLADLLRLTPGVVDVLRDSGDLERMLRAQLEPFYASPEVVALLE